MILYYHTEFTNTKNILEANIRCKVAEPNGPHRCSRRVLRFTSLTANVLLCVCFKTRKIVIKNVPHYCPLHDFTTLVNGDTHILMNFIILRRFTTYYWYADRPVVLVTLHFLILINHFNIGAEL